MDQPALYNVHEVTTACVYNCQPHLVAIVLGKEQAHCLAEQLTKEHEGFTFVATERNLNEPLVHFVDASFDLNN